MDRAFGELEEAFFRSGAVMSVESCTEDAKGPSRPPIIERSGGHALPGAEFLETVQLGMKGQVVELGGYYMAYVVDGPEQGDDYEELRIDTAA
jgi:hypothetical protein